MSSSNGTQPTTATWPADSTGVGASVDAPGHPLRRRTLTGLRDIGARDADGIDQQAAVNDEDPGSWDVELNHTRRPELDVAGSVDWGREDGAVRRVTRFEEVAPPITPTVAHEDELPAGWP